MPQPVMAGPLAVAVSMAEWSVTEETTGAVTEGSEVEPLGMSSGSSPPQASIVRPKPKRKNNLVKRFILKRVKCLRAVIPAGYLLKS